MENYTIILDPIHLKLTTKQKIENYQLTNFEEITEVTGQSF